MAIFMGCAPWSRRLRAEAAPVAGRADADPPSERPPHRLDRAEAGLAGDGLDRQVAGVEEDAGALDARGLHVDRRRHAGLVAEGAGEVALAHRRALREG